MKRILQEVEVIAVSLTRDKQLAPVGKVMQEAFDLSGDSAVRTVCANAPHHRLTTLELPLFRNEDWDAPMGMHEFVVCESCGDVLGGPGVGWLWRLRIAWRALRSIAAEVWS
jgi:hypothetical protein